MLKKGIRANGRSSYLGKWTGYDIGESTWEPEENLNNYREAINCSERKERRRRAEKREQKKGKQGDETN